MVVEKGATVVAWGDIRTWNSTSEVYPIFYQDVGTIAVMQSFSLTGGGVIDGQGWRWWPYGKSIHRPEMLHLSNANNVYINDTTFRDSPSFHVEVRGSNITISHSRVEAGIDVCGGYEAAPNTDAFNIGGSHIHLHDLWVHNGDDCVPTNVGPGNTVTHDVLVERVHCECGTNAAVAIIGGRKSPAPGLDNNTVRDVIYRDMTVNRTGQGIGFKISEAYENVTGQIVNVTWENIDIMDPTRAVIYMNVYEEDASQSSCHLPSDPARPHWLTAHNITYRNIRATTETYAGCFLCSPTRPCTGLLMDNVTVTAKGPFECFNAHGEAHDSSPEPCFA